MVERPADEQEEQERDRRVEIGVWPVDHRFVEAQAVGQRNPQRDRHIHVHAPVAKRVPRRAEEDPAREDEGRNGDQRRKPVEQVAGRIVRARPHRDRQQHDVPGGEARHRQSADEFRKQRVAASFVGLEQMRGIADAAEHVCDRRCFAAIMHRDAARRQVDARGDDAREPAQFALDLGDAGTAMRIGNRQVDLPHAVTEIAAGERQLARRGRGPARAAGEAGLGSGRAAAHLSLPPAIEIRRTSR